VVSKSVSKENDYGETLYSKGFWEAAQIPPSPQKKITSKG
jgi:hypothetical protein